MIDITDFIEHRKEIKKPLTQRAERMLIRKLERLQQQGHDVELLLENAIIGGWQTVYESEATKVKRVQKTHEVDFIELHTNKRWREGLEDIIQ
jgi:hypothetical protein